MSRFFLARQPIFDDQLEVRGYELLYRTADVEVSLIDNADTATMDVLLSSFLEVGLSRLIGQQRAFINLSRRFIINADMLPPANDRFVLEILEDIVVDQSLIDALRRLREAGYVIALDDFVFHEKLRPLVELADIIKIDLRTLDRQDIQRHLTILRRYPVQLLAEKIETLEEFEWCKSLGFDLFQGYFLCRPRIIQGRRLSASHAQIVRVLAQLQQPGLQIQQLEKLITEDVTMSYKLLRYINSAYYVMRTKIESIRHAIIYLGLNEMRRWANMVALSTVDDKPPELMKMCLIRGKMCELMTQMTGRRNPGTAFIVGMFSLLDAMLDIALEDLLSQLSLTDEVMDALLNNTGPYADVLHNAIAYEQGHWQDIYSTELSEDMISDMYVRAVEWAQQALTTIETKSA